MMLKNLNQSSQLWLQSKLRWIKCVKKTMQNLHRPRRIFRLASAEYGRHSEYCANTTVEVHLCCKTPWSSQPCRRDTASLAVQGGASSIYLRFVRAISPPTWRRRRPRKRREQRRTSRTPRRTRSQKHQVSRTSNTRRKKPLAWTKPSQRFLEIGTPQTQSSLR